MKRPGKRMSDDSDKKKRLGGIFLLGVLLLNYPVLSLFNTDERVLRAPILYVYLFGVWAVLIVLTALTTRSRR